MASLGKAAFVNKFSDPGIGLFKDNIIKDISEGDLRTFTTDIKDSFFNKIDDTTTNIVEGAKLFYTDLRARTAIYGVVTNNRLTYYDAATQKLNTTGLEFISALKLKMNNDLVVSGSIGIGTNVATAALDVAAGNIKLAASSATDGRIMQGAFSIFHTIGTRSLFVGIDAGNTSFTGSDGVFIGYQSGYNASVGPYNTGVGAQALYMSAGDGANNAAIGAFALRGISDGDNNFGGGFNAGSNITIGNRNICLGALSGIAAPGVGDDNILIGYNVTVPSGTSNYMSIGNTIYGDLANDRIGIGSTTLTSKINLPAAVDVAGGINFGNDTVLYRSAADTLKTDDSLVIGGIGSFAAGATATPSITFTGDLDTGIYQEAANQIGFTAGGTKSLVVNSTQILSVDGAIATPGYSFIGDPDTGMFRPTNNTIGWATSGTGRMILDNNANLLIGGTAAAATAQKTLHIFNSTAPTASIAGGILYVEAGALKFRGSAGTITILAVA